MGRCVSFSLAVPAARLFICEMNAAISREILTHTVISLTPKLGDPVSHWFLLEDWDRPPPWRDERHIQVAVATDASQFG